MTRESKKTKFFRILFLIISILLIGAITMVCAYLVWEKAPGDSGRDTFTIFISGIDEQTYSTDINLIIKMDSGNKKIDIVSVPSDTLLNIDFQIRKLGNVYFGSIKTGRDTWKAVDEELVKLLGFEVDAYAFIPKTVMQEFYSNGRIEDITTFFSILNSASDTNLIPSNIAYLIRQSVDITSEDVSYYNVPAEEMIIRGYNYDVIKLGEWISMLNSHLNTGNTTVSEYDIDIVYCLDGVFECTKELNGSWYYDNINERLYEGGNSDEYTVPAY